MTRVGHRAKVEAAGHEGGAVGAEEMRHKGGGVGSGLEPAAEGLGQFGIGAEFVGDGVGMGLVIAHHMVEQPFEEQQIARDRQVAVGGGHRDAVDATHLVQKIVADVTAGKGIAAERAQDDVLSTRRPPPSV